VFAFSYSAPSIILELGYSSTNAQFLLVPIYVLGAVSTIVCSWLADRWRVRWQFIVFPYHRTLCHRLDRLRGAHPNPSFCSTWADLLFLVLHSGWDLSAVNWRCRLERQQHCADVEKSAWNGYANIHWQSWRSHREQPLPCPARTSILAGLRLRHWNPFRRHCLYFHSQRSLPAREQEKRSTRRKSD
jgi:hypothetical protein